MQNVGGKKIYHTSTYPNGQKKIYCEFRSKMVDLFNSRLDKTIEDWVK